MRGFRRKAQLTCIISAVLLVLTAGYASAQSFPSQTELNTAQGGGFDFPTQLPLFASLAADANGIIANVTTGNFSNASALLSHYNSTIKQITSSANASQQGTTIGALDASQGSFTLLIANAQRFSVLNATEAPLLVAAPRGNASIANALEMQGLGNALTGLPGTISGQNADIYAVAVQNGLNLAPYGNATALLNAYAAQVNGRVANVTGAVFVTPTLTLTESAHNATYGDTLVLAGAIKSNQTGMSNVSVDVHVDNSTVATVSTAANGSYAYRLPILSIPAGAHVASVGYTPVDAPYKPAQSAPVKFSVAASPVNNTLSFLSSSIALGSNVQARGALTTATGPVANATVVLSIGGSNVASAQTDQNGSYSFSVSSLPLYLSAVPGGVTAYTVFDPSGQPLASAASATAHVPADLTGLFGIVVAFVLVVLLIFFLYRGGYLHDVGKVILLGERPREYDEVRKLLEIDDASVEQVESEILGCSHAQLGGYLMSIWGLPIALVQAVALHHCPSCALESEFSAVTAVHCADALVHVVQEGKEKPVVDAAYLDRLRLGERLIPWRNLLEEKRATLQ